MSKFYEEIGKLLKELHTERGLTQKEVADKLKTNRSTYANWEQGIRSIDIDTMFKICDIYDIDINEISKQMKRYIGK